VDNIIQNLLEEATLWVPKLIGVVLIFIVFFVLAKIIKGIINSGAERLKFDGNLTLLLARASRIALMIFGFVTCTRNVRY